MVLSLARQLVLLVDCSSSTNGTSMKSARGENTNMEVTAGNNITTLAAALVLEPWQPPVLLVLGLDT